MYLFTNFVLLKNNSLRLCVRQPSEAEVSFVLHLLQLNFNQSDFSSPGNNDDSISPAKPCQQIFKICSMQKSEVDMRFDETI